MDARVLRELRSYAKQVERPLSSLLTEAVAEYLERIKVRPAFRAGTDAVMKQHEELLQRLAR